MVEIVFISAILVIFPTFGVPRANPPILCRKLRIAIIVSAGGGRRLVHPSGYKLDS
jgi:hypothetical protein